MEPAEYATMALLENSHWWYVGLRGLVQRALTSEVGKRGALRILDAGCGTGGRFASLSEIFPKSLVVGVDIAPKAIHYAARQKAGQVAYGSANYLPFKERAFDVVLCIDVLDVQGIEEKLALQEMHRILRPGGLFLVNVPAFESLRGTHDGAVHRRHRYRRKELCKILTHHGFVVEKLMYWNAFLFPVMFVVRRLLRKSGTAPLRSDLKPLPRPLNRFLTTLLAMDIWVCAKINVPFGTSVFSIASKVHDPVTVR